MTPDKLDELEALLAKAKKSSVDLSFRSDTHSRDAYLVLVALIATIRAQGEEITRYREAMTPSGATKAAYHGEFSFEIVEQGDSEMCEVSRKVYVPWTTVKEIMGRIHARCQP